MCCKQGAERVGLLHTPPAVAPLACRAGHTPSPASSGSHAPHPPHTQDAPIVFRYLDPSLTPGTLADVAALQRDVLTALSGFRGLRQGFADDLRRRLGFTSHEAGDGQNCSGYVWTDWVGGWARERAGSAG